MKTSRKNHGILLVGCCIGVIAAALAVLGNPANMGFCIACFLRDTAGGLKLHSAAVVQYVRPEIIGLVLGSFFMALVRGEFRPRGGSAPGIRFVIGFFVMVGCLVFLGCPFRMLLRLAGGDLNALTGLSGFCLGILAGVFFLKRGYSLGRTYRQPVLEGIGLPVTSGVLLALLLLLPALLAFSETGPGSKHAPIAASLAAGLAVGALAQRSRLCMAGGIRDALLFRHWRLLWGCIGVFGAALAANLLLGSGFTPGFSNQPVSHSAHVWNGLGMMLVGFGSVLLGGCPLRQLILSGEGNSDSAAAVLGFVVGAAFCHNFGLAASADSLTDGVYRVGGPSTAGKIAVIIGLIVLTVIAACASKRRKGETS